MTASHQVSRLFRAVILAVLMPVVGCTTVETQSFRVDQDSTVESAQIAVGADFGKYDTLMAEDMGIYFPQNSPATAADLARIRDIFREAFLGELESYRITLQPGPTTMAVQASLIDLRNASASQVPALRSDIQDIARSGSLVFLMEMKDSQTGKVLARAGDSAEAPAFAAADGAQTDWQSVEAAAQKWAELFRRFLDENLGR